MLAKRPRPRLTRRRSGQSLIEFAVVALVTYLLLAAILTFGLWFYAAQSTQTTVDLAAREISRTPLPASGLELKAILYDDIATIDPQYQDAVQDVRKRIFDPRYLVLTKEVAENPIQVNKLPLVNRQLLQLMIYDEIGGEAFYRYPGAVYQDLVLGPLADPPTSGYLVAIPIVTARAADGVETIDWVPVLEPLLVFNPDTGVEDDPFLITTEPARGVVALRLNYPAQSAAMSSFRHEPTAADYPFEPTIGRPNVADDAAVDDDGGKWAPPAISGLAQSDFEYGPYAGQYGLGQQAALGSQELTGRRPVRPFRRVISAQAIYRREVFE